MGVHSAGGEPPGTGSRPCRRDSRSGPDFTSALPARARHFRRKEFIGAAEDRLEYFLMSTAVAIALPSPLHCRRPCMVPRFYPSVTMGG